MQGTRGIVLFAHGSSDPRWRAPTEAVAAEIKRCDPEVRVLCAYLERTEPDLPTAVNQLAAAGARRISVLPIFLGSGKHVRDDLPRQLTALQAAHPQLQLSLLPMVGENPQLIALLAQIALEN